MMITTYKIIVTGQVQGVGFRPYVYRLAQLNNLKGSVFNNDEGVVILVQGCNECVDRFYKTLITSPPEVSRIERHQILKIDHQIFNDFNIIPSVANDKLNLQLTPDFGICNSCKEDILDGNNRRFYYPFTTCINCGPRWAITKTFPFDRFNTSMSIFDMCTDCEEEYGNPDDRRFHSQTNSCDDCGISLYLIDDDQKRMPEVGPPLFKKLKTLLEEGAIIAIKNTSGYVLCCDARNDEVVQKLRLKKRRPQKPFALLYPNLALIKSHLNVEADEETTLTSAIRPIVLLEKLANAKSKISNAVAPNLNHLGVMLPNSGVLQLLTNEIGFPIVATSGNISGSPILSDSFKAHEELKQVADFFLEHNLEVVHPQDDTVLKHSKRFSVPILIRRSRGYAPNYYDFKTRSNEVVLAMGSDLKSTISFLPNDYLYVSQYIGNLESYEVYNRYVQVASDFLKMFSQKPKTVIVDFHPSYQSASQGLELAKKYAANLVKIQHHKAHLASVLSEHQLMESKDPILGIVWDGTGYGDDGHIWGGEFFNYHNYKIERVSHFEYFEWLAGDKMAKEPRLSLFSLIDEDQSKYLSHKFTEEELRIYKSIKNQNTLKTSSVGRLFDAVASLLEICDVNTYEGEAAIKLENLVENYSLNDCRLYTSELIDGLVSTASIINGVKCDLINGLAKDQIACNFLYTLSHLVLIVAREQKVDKIALSGGVFQNTVLVDMLVELAASEFELFFNRNLSPNDENISVGQMMYYLHKIDRR